MKFVSFLNPDDSETPYLGCPYLGVLDGEIIEDFGIEAGDVLIQILGAGRTDVKGLRWYLEQYAVKRQLSEVELKAPLPFPVSLRDFNVFENHMKTAYNIAGREIPAAWYDMPFFHFINHTSIYGPDETITFPGKIKELDFELEIACVIGKEGRDIHAKQAEEYVMGYMIFNDWSARDIQRLEISIGFGPTKSKDFASSFGPYLVTPDELEDRTTGRVGVYDLEITARVNDQEVSRGNWKNMHYSFGEMIAHASEGATLKPGDVLGSGPISSGCLFETTNGKGPWLQPGDIVELEVERLGVLVNTVGEIE